MSFKIEEPDGSVYDHAETVAAEKKILDAAPDVIDMTLDQAYRMVGERRLKWQQMQRDLTKQKASVSQNMAERLAKAPYDAKLWGRKRKNDVRFETLQRELFMELDELSRLEESLIEKFKL